MMKKHSGRLCSATTLLLVGVVACTGIQEPQREEDASLQTDRLSYSLRRMGDYVSTRSIELRLTNTTDAPAFLLVLGAGIIAVVLDRLEDGEWVTRYRPSVPDGITGVVRLDPGESTAFETTIEGFLPGTCVCEPIVNLEDGVYRFRLVDYVDSYDEERGLPGNDLPVEFHVSNRFALDAQ